VDILISWPGGDWQATARLFAVLLTSYLLVFWFASVLWVYRDIRARTSDPVTQGIAVAIAVVFPIVGLPVYMVLRPAETVQQAYERQLEQEAILSELHSISACPSCRRPIDSDWVVCSSSHGVTARTAPPLGRVPPPRRPRGVRPSAPPRTRPLARRLVRPAPSAQPRRRRRASHAPPARLRPRTSRSRAPARRDRGSATTTRSGATASRHRL
jgi:hypothetical protein